MSCEQQPEFEKKYDRRAALEALKAIVTPGYWVEKARETGAGPMSVAPKTAVASRPFSLRSYSTGVLRGLAKDGVGFIDCRNRPNVFKTPGCRAPRVRLSWLGGTASRAPETLII